MKNKKSQIQMMETISILLIFFAIVFIGLIFYVRVMQSNKMEKIEEFRELFNIQIAQVASSLPELQCSEDNIIKSNCIDLLKLEKAEPVMSFHSSDYFDLFAYSNITVRKIFPGHASEEWQLYARTKEGSRFRIYFPISLYDPKDGVYSFGLMVIEVYP